jgi:hypothetical protein
MATLKNLPASVLQHRAGTGRNVVAVPSVVYTITMLVSNVFFASSSLLSYFLHLASRILFLTFHLSLLPFCSCSLSPNRG